MCFMKTNDSYADAPITEITPQLTEGKAAVLGFQHLLAMYSGDVIVPLLIGLFTFYRRPNDLFGVHRHFHVWHCHPFTN